MTAQDDGLDFPWAAAPGPGSGGASGAAGDDDLADALALVARRPPRPVSAGAPRSDAAEVPRPAPGDSDGRAAETGGHGDGKDDHDGDGVEDALALVGRSLDGRAHGHGHGHGGGGGGLSGGGHRHTLPWAEARAIAARAGRAAPLATQHEPLDRAQGQLLAEPLTALTDLPSFDTSAMDGWAVAGPGPWTVESSDSGILAGHGGPEPLIDGTAVRIATGARIPAGATAVIRSEHARTDGSGHLHAQRQVTHGQDIRPRGQECRSGDQLLPAGTVVTPAVLGLAAAAGYDRLHTVRRPRVDVLVLGDELLTEGLPHAGLIRDALGPMIGPWLRALGAEVLVTRRIGDDAEALHRAVTTSEADLLVTTGGTAAGPVDHVHPVLSKAGAGLLVDGVAVRPGHPMLLAELGPGRYLVGLPGNPLAAVSGLLTLAEPLLRGMSGQVATSAPYPASLQDEVHGHPQDTRLVPVVRRADRLVPLHYNGPAMLRGIAAAQGLAVVPPGGARAGDELELLDLPWSPTPGGCFT
ncbi:molybdopterin molybdotransferase MoeA [Streptomyces sp. FIT100]|uniref:molybdopterin molybdotransferase MoeA n=1 Tax=Streptomyces sp. FIT100 TaxID=2837956 RepID=UPI0021C6DD40|nr:molybdopterin molybdotransferase MoeA [Streptomyces sp. FIT100]UUN28063.1 molybdopterin molybdotransferase MoeA [Streptomyces sp. FIT100]